MKTPASISRRNAVGVVSGGLLGFGATSGTRVAASGHNDIEVEQLVENYRQLEVLDPEPGTATTGVQGAEAAEDGGAGTFVLDRDGDPTEADGGTVVPAVGGGVWRRRFHDVIDARWFGVRADGEKDDTAALQAAVDAAIRAVAVLTLPVGTVLITAPITLTSDRTSRNLVLTGRGQQETNLLLREDGCLDLDLGAVGEFETGRLEILNLGIRCDSQGTTTALTARFDRETGSTTQTAILENLEVTGVDDDTGPRVGIRLIDSCAARIRGSRIQGRRSGYGTDSVGILFQGNSIPVEIYVSEVNAYFLHTAFKVDGEHGTRLEGIHFDKVAVVAADYGIVARAHDDDQSLWLKVTGSHLNCTRSGIQTHNYLNLMLTENLMYGLPASGDSLDFVGVDVTGNAAPQFGSLSVISNNICVYMGESTADRIGFRVDGSESEDTILMNGNVLGFMETGIHLAPGASRVAIGSTNLFRGNGLDVRDDGTDNVIAPELASWS